MELPRGGALAIGGYVELQEESDELARRRCSSVSADACERMRPSSRGSAFTKSEHHQFSGASLALTAEAYRRCGGLPVRAALEDEALEHELKARGVTIHRSLRVSVRTSARVDGRAPRGLARDLARTTGARGAPMWPSSSRWSGCSSRSGRRSPSYSRRGKSPRRSVRSPNRPQGYATAACSTRCSSSTPTRPTARPRSRRGGAHGPTGGRALPRARSGAWQGRCDVARAAACSTATSSLSSTPTPKGSASISSRDCSGR